MALDKNVIDIPVGLVNQVTAEHEGILGTLKRLKNAVVEKYQAGQLPKVKVQPRYAFTALAQLLHSAATGETVATGATEWIRPSLLADFNGQLISVSNGKPRIDAGDNEAFWVTYDTDRVVTRQLEARSLYASNRTIYVPDSAELNGVTCEVHTEVTGGGSPVTQLWIGFKSQDGSWLRPPFHYTPTEDSDTHRTVGKVVHDGDRFWIFASRVDGTDPVITVALFSNTGQLMHETSVVRHDTTHDPGIFDVTARATGIAADVLLAQWDGSGGVEFTSFVYDQINDEIDATVSIDTSAKCSGQLGWLRNDVDALAYLATAYVTESGRLFAYQVTGTAQTHEYDPSHFISDPTFIDSLSGFVVVNAGHAPTVNILVGHLANPTDSQATLGPLTDPALRYSNLILCTDTNANQAVKQFDSTVPVTRPFRIDDTWYSWFYYQSGTGITVDQSGIDVTIDPGDYFVGQSSQTIKVKDGDRTYGAPFILPGADILVNAAHAGVNIDGGGTADKVEVIETSGLAGYQDGTQMLRWTFKNATFGINNAGTILKCNASSIASANAIGGWDVTVAESTTTRLTSITSRDGTTVVAGNFTTTGTVETLGTVRYQLPNLENMVSPDVARFFNGGNITIAGASPGGNNGTFTILRCIPKNVRSSTDFPINFGSYQAAIWTLLTTQNTFHDSSGTFTANIATPFPNAWVFDDYNFSSTPQALDKLTVENDTAPVVPFGPDVSATNNGEFVITSQSIDQLVTNDSTAAGVLPQIFHAPFPDITVELPVDASPMTLHLTNITFDDSFRGAIISVVDADNAVNNGVYRIIDLDPADSHVATVASQTGATNQVNDTLQSATVTIYKPLSFIDPFQSVWLMQALQVNTKALSGACELGRAFADWRVEADTTFGPTMFPCCLSTVNATDAGLRQQWVLPYRGESVTANLPVVAPKGQLAGITRHTADAIGLKVFSIERKYGQAASTQATMLLPGTLGAEYTSSGFSEHGVVVSAEAPFVLSTAVASAGQLSLIADQEYQYVVQHEYMDESGQRTFSVPSPALNVKFSSGHNTVTLGGRLPMPLGTDGLPGSLGVAGVTNRLVAINIYRTCIVGTAPDWTQTKIHYKVTSDLNVNGLEPVTSSNPSGFAFPDPFTWTYIDSNPDATVLGSEELLTDKGFLPRYPCPAFKAIVGSWLNRTWVIGYDNAVWFSGEHTEGDATWFHPEQRFQLPEDDRLVTLSAMEGYLVIFTDRSVWYLPSSNNLPDAGGQGLIPNPVKTPFTNGCTGWAVTLRDGVAYSSTAGGVWLVGRDFSNVWLSQPIVDVLTSEILGLHVDGRQRMHVPTSGGWFVWDQVVGYWYEFSTGLPGPIVACVHQGEAHYQSFGSGVFSYTPGNYADMDVDGNVFAIAPDIEFNTFDFANTRGYKRCWQMQLVGKYVAEHQVNIVLSYPETTRTATTYEPKTPDPDLPFIIPFAPQYQLTPSFHLRVFASFTDVEVPGASFELEMVSAEVGVTSKPGLVKQGKRFSARR